MRQTSKRLRPGTLILFLTATFICVAAPRAYTRAPAPQLQLEHRLHLFHTHTGERLDIVFRQGDAYVPEAIAKLAYFLRDHRTGEVRHFDLRIYDILEELTYTVGRPSGQIDIVCGYPIPTLWGFHARSSERRTTQGHLGPPKFDSAAFRFAGFTFP